MAANTDMHRPPTTDVFSHKHHDREQDPHSSQPSSSSDSFSAYVHHDAPIVQQRSSSPRLEHSLHDREGPTASPSARAQALKHRLASTTSDPFARAQFHQVQRTHFDPVRHLAHQQPQDDPKGDDEEYDELEDDEPVFRPQSHHPETAAFRGKAKDDDSSIVSTLYHVKSQNAVSAEEMRARKRRRRTRPDEVSILASVYAQNAFPDAQTRAELASRVGMSVRAVSIWFQNRRQAEKKRSQRYGGSGIAGGGGLERTGSSSNSRSSRSMSANPSGLDGSMFGSQGSSKGGSIHGGSMNGGSVHGGSLNGDETMGSMDVHQVDDFGHEDSTTGMVAPAVAAVPIGIEGDRSILAERRPPSSGQDDRPRPFLYDKSQDTEANKENIPPWAVKVAAAVNGSTDGQSDKRSTLMSRTLAPSSERRPLLSRSSSAVLTSSTPPPPRSGLQRSGSKDLRDLIGSVPGRATPATRLGSKGRSAFARALTDENGPLSSIVDQSTSTSKLGATPVLNNASDASQQQQKRMFDRSATLGDVTNVFSARVADAVGRVSFQALEGSARNGVAAPTLEDVIGPSESESTKAPDGKARPPTRTLPRQSVSTKISLDAVAARATRAGVSSPFGRAVSSPAAYDHSSDLEEDAENVPKRALGRSVSVGTGQASTAPKLHPVGGRMISISANTAGCEAVSSIPAFAGRTAPVQIPQRTESGNGIALFTTSGGRASLSNSLAPSPAVRDQSTTAQEPTLSLNSRLPSALAAALQRQGIIAKPSMTPAQQGAANSIWQRMQSSSNGSSSDPITESDALGGNAGKAATVGVGANEPWDEDEETTLRLIASRRAAKAQTRPNINAKADARTAMRPQRLSSGLMRGTFALSLSGTPRSSPSLSASKGLRRIASLDWAASRDRALDPAPAPVPAPALLPATPLSSSRSLSVRSNSHSTSTRASRLATPHPLSSTPVGPGPSTGERKRAYAYANENEAPAPLSTLSSSAAAARQMNWARTSSERSIRSLPTKLARANGNSARREDLSSPAALYARTDSSKRTRLGLDQLGHEHIRGHAQFQRGGGGGAQPRSNHNGRVLSSGPTTSTSSTYMALNESPPRARPGRRGNGLLFPSVSAGAGVSASASAGTGARAGVSTSVADFSSYVRQVRQAARESAARENVNRDGVGAGAEGEEDGERRTVVEDAVRYANASANAMDVDGELAEEGDGELPASQTSAASDEWTMAFARKARAGARARGRAVSVSDSDAGVGFERERVGEGVDDEEDEEEEMEMEEHKWRRAAKTKSADNAHDDSGVGFMDEDEDEEVDQVDDAEEEDEGDLFRGQMGSEGKRLRAREQARRERALLVSSSPFLVHKKDTKGTPGKTRAQVRESRQQEAEQQEDKEKARPRTSTTTASTPGLAPARARTSTRTSRRLLGKGEEDGNGNGNGNGNATRPEERDRDRDRECAELLLGLGMSREG